jgi:hypothetical protein
MYISSGRVCPWREMLTFISTLLFNPLTGEQIVDPTLITAELAKLKDANPKNYDFYIDGKITPGREPDEIIMICVDTSWSMGLDANFDDTRAVRNDSDFDRVPSNLGGVDIRCKLSK